jgi:hypothetical protein
MPSQIMEKQSAVQCLGHALILLEMCAAAARPAALLGKLLKTVGRVYNGALNDKLPRNWHGE